MTESTLVDSWFSVPGGLIKSKYGSRNLCILVEDLIVVSHTENENCVGVLGFHCLELFFNSLGIGIERGNFLGYNEWFAIKTIAEVSY